MQPNSDGLKRVLDLLEKTIDPDLEQRKQDDWTRFYDGETFEPYFDLSACYDRPIDPEPLEHVNINDALDDPELMMQRELTGSAYHTACKRQPTVMNIRANYGTGILPSLFGTRPFIMERDLDTLPTNWPLDSVDDIRRILDAGVPDLNAGLGHKVFETTQFYLDVLQDYPLARRWVHVYHPDLQGPIDVVELLWSSKMFLALLDTPDLVKQTLELVTETYVRFLKKWYAMVPPEGELTAHWGVMIPGHVMLRDDSVVNLSPDMYDEFCRPYEQRLLEEFSGGGVHYCGRGHHAVPSMVSMDGLRALNISQPEMNDMDVIFSELKRTDTAIFSLRIDTDMLDRYDLSRKVAGFPAAQ